MPTLAWDVSQPIMENSMKLAEFKSWFDGYTEDMAGVPSEAQWSRIKARISEIDGNGVTERVYLDRYWPAIRPWQPYYGPAYAQNASMSVGSVVFDAGLSSADRYAADHRQTPAFDGIKAMYAAGKAEALAS